MPPPEPPLPAAATFATAAQVLTVTWNKPLTAQPTAAANWIVRASTKQYNAIIPGASAGLQTTVPMAFQFIDFGPDVVSYAAAPPDVLSLPGIPAAPFANFPLAVLP